MSNSSTKTKTSSESKAKADKVRMHVDNAKYLIRQAGLAATGEETVSLLDDAIRELRNVQSVFFGYKV